MDNINTSAQKFRNFANDPLVNGRGDSPLRFGQMNEHSIQFFDMGDDMNTLSLEIVTAFREALRATYGDHIANFAFSSESHQDSNPLTADQIKEALKKADALESLEVGLAGGSSCHEEILDAFKKAWETTYKAHIVNFAFPCPGEIRQDIISNKSVADRIEEAFEKADALKSLEEELDGIITEVIKFVSEHDINHIPTQLNNAAYGNFSTFIDLFHRASNIATAAKNIAAETAKAAISIRDQSEINIQVNIANQSLKHIQSLQESMNKICLHFEADGKSQSRFALMHRRDYSLFFDAAQKIKEYIETCLKETQGCLKQMNDQLQDSSLLPSSNSGSNNS
ncbi:MAG: hypothetical protein ACH349_07450, partial [Candidatus Rhabdochlamydia sp.]